MKLTALPLFVVVALLPAPRHELSVRFHHVHYRAANPAEAIRTLAEHVNGRRLMLPGLGVGVGVGDEFVLYDPTDVTDLLDAVQPPPREAYQSAVAWLKERGLIVTTASLPAWAADAARSTYHHFAFAAADFDAVVAKLGPPDERRAESVFYGNVEIVREALPDAFWCPMHPDVRSGRAGKCPLCGMDLVPIPPPKIGEYKLDVAVQRTARGASGVILTVRDPETLAAVREFTVVHEKSFHLFIISRDLEYFAHVHPEQAKDGSFVLKHPLPPGEYMLIADFLPSGGSAQMVQRAILVSTPTSGVRSRLSTAVENRDLTAREAVVDGVRVALKVEDAVAGKDACLTFTLTDAQTGTPVADLQPFLGAPAHMLMVRGDLSDAVHAHPEEHQTSGPTVSFHPLIPAAGDYKLWVQFQRAGRVTTVPFWIRATN